MIRLYGSAAPLLVCVAVLASGRVCAQTPPAVDATAQATIPDVGKGAEEVASQLRELTRSLSDTEAFSALEAGIDKATGQAASVWDDTGRVLARRPGTTALDSLTSSWLALRSELATLSDRIGARVDRREADVATLITLRASWARALDLARAAQAPAPVVDRVENTIAAIDATRPGIEQQRARVMVLGDSVSRGLQTCDDALARIDDARREAVERIFSRQAPPV